jgi:hypothetical protein
VTRKRIAQGCNHGDQFDTGVQPIPSRPDFTDLRSARYWYDRAELVRAKADRVPNIAAKVLLLDIADSYDLLAERAVQREVRMLH